MDFEESVSRGPKNIEQLHERELIARLHHELSIIYDRVFLTGDWKGEQANTDDDIRENVFEDEMVNDAEILSNAIAEFLRDVRETLPKAVRPEDMKTTRPEEDHETKNKHDANRLLFIETFKYETKDKHDANRLLFIETLKYVEGILRRTMKDVGTREHIDMAKVIDENIHYFRDFQVNTPEDRKGALLQSSKKKDEGLVLQGLQRINVRLSDIYESMGWRQGPSDVSKAA